MGVAFISKILELFAQIFMKFLKFANGRFRF